MPYTDPFNIEPGEDWPQRAGLPMAFPPSGLTRLSIQRLRAARHNLQVEGLLSLVGNSRAGSARRTFVVAPLRRDLTYTPNITPMPTRSGGIPKERRSKITYDA